MLVDTDVVIWYMRGNPHAAELLDNRESIVLSAVTGLHHGLSLLSANVKHYRMIDHLELHLFRPN